MKRKAKEKKIIMVGPALEALGGISRVAKIWQDNAFFSRHNVKYVPSVSDACINRILFLIKNLLKFFASLIGGDHLAYVHTALYRSLYRKSLFIIIAFSLRKKVILHIHPSVFSEFLSDLEFPQRQFVYWLFRRIETFVVLTNGIKDDIHRSFPQKKVFVLPNLISIEEMTNRKNYERKENSLIYLGWFVKEKGVYELVDAIQYLVQLGMKTQLNFYGTKEVEKLKAYITYKNLTEHITVNGWISNEKKLKVFYESTALILPSHTEGIPNVILEAMATKTPIVTTHVGGLKEILKHRENAILAEVGNPRDLSEKILECLKNKELRDTITCNAYHTACTKYDVHAGKKKFAKIIQSVSASHYLL